jgi:hypothetical protein
LTIDLLCQLPFSHWLYRDWTVFELLRVSKTCRFPPTKQHRVLVISWLGSSSRDKQKNLIKITNPHNTGKSAIKEMICLFCYPQINVAICIKAKSPPENRNVLFVDRLYAKQKGLF